MHVIITGAAGIVGSHTLRYFLAQNHTVTALDISPLPEALLNTFSKEWLPRLTSQVVDLTDLRAFETVVANSQVPVDAVVHIGGIPNPLSHDARIVYNVNVSSNYNVLQTCAKFGIKRIVQASSVNAYGLSFTPAGHKRFEELPMTEESPVRPEDPYATSKVCCEIQADAVARFYPELRIASLRYHMCKETYKIASGESRHLSLWGWVSLKSCATAALLAITSEGWSGHERFNLVSDEICWEGGLDPSTRFNGERASSLDLLEANWKGKVDKLDRSFWAENPRKGFWDTTKAKTLLGWTHEDITE